MNILEMDKIITNAREKAAERNEQYLSEYTNPLKILAAKMAIAKLTPEQREILRKRNPEGMAALESEEE